MIRLQDILPAEEKPVSRALVALLALVAFFLPFKFIVNLFIFAAFLVWFFTPSFRKLFTKQKASGSLVTILVFYLLHAVGFFYTTNIQESFFNLEVKLSLLIFPLIFY